MTLIIYNSFVEIYWSVYNVLEFLIESSSVYFTYLQSEKLKREVHDIDSKYSKFKLIF